MTDDSNFDHVVRYCAHCNEEYQVPEDMETCPICLRKELVMEGD